MTTTAKYHISERDYADSQRLSVKLSSKAIRNYVMAGLVYVGIVNLLPNELRYPLLGGLAGGIAVGVFFRYVVTPIQARRHYKKYKAIHEEFEIEITEDGLKMSTRNGSWVIRWDQALKWRENDKFFLIYPMPRIYYFIPKHIASQGFDFDLLREKLTRHVGASV